MAPSASVFGVEQKQALRQSVQEDVCRKTRAGVSCQNERTQGSGEINSWSCVTRGRCTLLSVFWGGFSHLSFWFLAAKEHHIFVGTLQDAEHHRFPLRLSLGCRPRLSLPPRDAGERTGGRMGRVGGGAECVRHIYSICVMYAGLHFMPGKRTVC